ncbi:hypothetical protein [Sphingobium boeckii]|uniref:Uncharacterized protein n=1 Tax=Sphingobium boeckii TaxID=1082345 RepID=A0A7W9AK08_9SPHN|nr:hypothetical protein [Sphingobium boeckii]MBB5687113.1 hypothetical protein [Sphingobium boeckii]
MIERFGFNLTQIAGILAFVIASLACLIASGARRKSRDLSIWRGLSIVYGLLAIEMIAAMRHRIHDFVNALLKITGEYSARSGLQEMLIAALAIVILTAMGLYLMRLGKIKASTRLAASATMTLVGLFLLEMISLHAIDAILYRPIGPLMVITYLWIAASTVTVITAWRYRKGR